MYEDGSTLTGLDWNANMAAFSFIVSTWFPEFSLLLRERALVAAGHVAPKIWEPKIREREKSNK